MEDKQTFLDPSLSKQFKGHRGGITSLYFNPNEQQIASGSLDNSVLLWDLGSTVRSYRFRGHEEAVMDVTFSPSGKYMASASRDKTVRLWAPTITGSTGMFKAHSQTVRSVQFSYDNCKIVTASDDKIVKLWASERYKFISSFVGHTNWVRCARLSHDDSVIASCSDDKTTKLWNPDSGELIHTYKDQKGQPLYLAWHPSGCYLAIGTSQGTIKLFDIRTHNLVQYYSIHNDAVTNLAFHPSGSYILTASKDGKMKVLDLLEGHPIFTLNGHAGPVNAVGFSLSGDTFASAGDDKLVNIWRTNFTQQANHLKENIDQNTVPRTASQTSKMTSSRGNNQGAKLWYLCYHSNKYPVTSFDQNDQSTEIDPEQFECEKPNANSTLADLVSRFTTPIVSIARSIASSTQYKSQKDSQSVDHTENATYTKSCLDTTDFEADSGHASHIPRSPPTPATYTIPSVYGHSSNIPRISSQEDLYGMIKLKENDVCYTSGDIEWVGRKRMYPINCGFKVLSDKQYPGCEPARKVKCVDKSFLSELDKINECNCADVLPTVHAIVDHLNALHEAVDLVEIRLGSVEDSLNKNE